MINSAQSPLVSSEKLPVIGRPSWMSARFAGRSSMCCGGAGRCLGRRIPRPASRRCRGCSSAWHGPRRLSLSCAAAKAIAGLLRPVRRPNGDDKAAAWACASEGNQTKSPASIAARGAFVSFVMAGSLSESSDANVLGRPGSDRLSRGLSRSTIGAGGFNGRVRNGIGWNSSARTTRSAKNVCTIAIRAVKPERD